VQFQSPTSGQVQVIPPEHWDEALKLGYKPTSHKVMYSPEGQRGMVPNAELADHARKGYQTTPKTQAESTPPAEPPSQFSQDHPYLDAAGRFTGTAIRSGLTAPFRAAAGIYHAVADPLSPEEEADFKGHYRLPGEVTAERLLGARQIVDAGKTYVNPETRPTLQGALSVAPEALGEGVGNAAIGPKVAGAGLGALGRYIGRKVYTPPTEDTLFDRPSLTEKVLPNP